MAAGIKKFIDSCVSTFKLMEHSVQLTLMQSPWQFTSINHRGDRHYTVFCTPSIRTNKALIQACLRQLDLEQTRFVVVALTTSSNDHEHAQNLNYCLVTLDEILRFGDEMLEIRSRENRIQIAP